MTMTVNKFDSEAGFSALELIIVLVFVGILSVMATISFNSTEIEKADAQASAVIDVLQEARQRALGQRTTMRVEINLTDRVVQIINENNPGNANDDQVIKTNGFVEGGVFFGTGATNVSGSPTELSPTPNVVFATSVHPLSTGDNVATLRFQRDGTVTNAGTDAIGTGAVPTGATIHVWSKYTDDTSANPTNGQIFRAITVLASSGLTRLWECPKTSGSCSNWKKK